MEIHHWAYLALTGDSKVTEKIQCQRKEKTCSWTQPRLKSSLWTSGGGRRTSNPYQSGISLRIPGVHIEADLSWGADTSNLVKKALQRLSLMKSNRGCWCVSIAALLKAVPWLWGKQSIGWSTPHGRSLAAPSPPSKIFTVHVSSKKPIKSSRTHSVLGMYCLNSYHQAGSREQLQQEQTDSSILCTQLLLLP